MDPMSFRRDQQGLKENLILAAMEFSSNFFLLSSIFFFSSALLLFLHRRIKPSLNRRLPPGPLGWPILGNMLDLGTMPHRTLFGLRPKYGDVIWLRLGSMNSMAILSAKAATEFFKNHDLSFAERTITETMRVHDYHKGSLALAPYGSYWRILRRLVTVDMLVHKRINDTAIIRRKCVDNMLLWIEEDACKLEAKCGLHVARFVFLMTFNLLGNLMLSQDLLDPQSKDGSEFFTAMMGLMEWSGYANLSDYFPWLRWLDLQGLRRNMERDLGKALEIASKFVKERLMDRPVGAEKKKDFLDLLLEFEGNGIEEPAKISDRDLNIFILVEFLINKHQATLICYQKPPGTTRNFEIVVEKFSDLCMLYLFLLMIYLFSFGFGPSSGHSLLDAKACYVSANQGLCSSTFDSSWMGKNTTSNSEAKKARALWGDPSDETGQNYDKEQLKCRWDVLKVDWRVWEKLKGLDTNLGWDALKGTIDASGDWWDMKLKEVPKASKFRHKGQKLDRMFRDVAATRAKLM
ncbi:hypothetical protein SO802_010263 [Lithocarpus litseifolius]|uniref:Myb/SANT-like domain-containing protein n=1 Tax=Lithocarpus litseifolius TaxID=425828 RepID=A0AAW2DI57_9ROSI